MQTNKIIFELFSDLSKHVSTIYTRVTELTNLCSTMAERLIAIEHELHIKPVSKTVNLNDYKVVN